MNLKEERSKATSQGPATACPLHLDHENPTCQLGYGCKQTVEIQAVLQASSAATSPLGVAPVPLQGTTGWEACVRLACSVRGEACSGLLPLTHAPWGQHIALPALPRSEDPKELYMPFH